MKFKILLCIVMPCCLHLGVGATNLGADTVSRPLSVILPAGVNTEIDVKPLSVILPAGVNTEIDVRPLSVILPAGVNTEINLRPVTVQFAETARGDFTMRPLAVGVAAPVPIAIDPVTSPTHSTTQTITGAMEVTSTVTVTVSTAAVVGPVTYPTSTTWGCTLTGLVQGINNITATAVDAANHRTTAATSISVTGPTMSNIGVSRNVLDTSTPDTTTIFLTLDSSATVTLKIIPELTGPSGAAIYQASQACPAAGPYLFIWDGKNSSGQTVPDGAYLYVLEASGGTLTSLYSPALPTGAGSISCSTGAGYDPYRNIPLDVNYSLGQAGYVTLRIKYGGTGTVLLGGMPKLAGQYIYDWDGRDGNGVIVEWKDLVTVCTSSLLGENTIITTGNAPEISNIVVDPYIMNLSFGNTVKVSYDLLRNSTIQVQLKSPAGSVSTILPNKLQLAGTNSVTWDGLQATDLSDMAVYAGSAGNSFGVTSEGYYTISITATDPVTGVSVNKKRTLSIGY